MKKAVSIALALSLLATPALAHHRHHTYHYTEPNHQDWNWGFHQTYNDVKSYISSLGKRPAAWCGWEMRQLVGSDPGPSYNLARNWAHWGHAISPYVGAVLV